jgi:hypothetical protein
MTMRPLHFFLVTLCAVPALAGTLKRDDAYTIESIAFPKEVPPEVGAVGFNSAGELVVALRRSDVLIARPAPSPDGFQWRRFAKGLHNACGMHVVSPHEIVISQMAELTRIVDTDRDGRADLYENICSDWGLSGNYHETAHLTPDGRGGWFVAPGTASHNGPVFYNVRGRYSKVGRRGRNFSATDYRGWVLHVDAQGRMTPWCSGFRMHNGILLDRDGNLWAGDNQGDWKATTPFYHLEKGRFYGHPSSLIWSADWDARQDPLLLPAAKLDALKSPAAVLLPHDIMCRSAGEPVQMPDDTFGPYGGQILLPDVAGNRICRLMLEKVAGAYQGAVTLMFDGNGLRPGNNRVCFSPDGGTLYVGQTMRGWGNLAEGLQRITWRGRAPFDVKTMSLTKDGFRLEFTRPVARSGGRFELQSYRYEDTAEYGGPKLDVTKVNPAEIRRAAETMIEIQVPGLQAGGRVYELKLDLRDIEGNPLWSDTFCYTVNRLQP